MAIVAVLIPREQAVSFAVEVLCRGRWEEMRPSGAEPYRWATLAEAEAACQLCYPGEIERPTELRVTRVKETP